MRNEGGRAICSSCRRGSRMARRKSPASESLVLLVEIGEVSHCYYIAETHGENGRVEDEAITSILGHIADIDGALKRFLGQRIDMSFICARSFSRKEPRPTADKPFLLPIQLRKDTCSLAAYLPAGAYWSLPAMISTGAITHVEARFDKPLYGTGDLLEPVFCTNEIGDSGLSVRPDRQELPGAECWAFQTRSGQRMDRHCSPRIPVFCVPICAPIFARRGFGTF